MRKHNILITVGISVVAAFCALLGKEIYDELRRKEYCSAKGYDRFYDEDTDDDIEDFDNYDLDADEDNLFNDDLEENDLEEKSEDEE